METDIVYPVSLLEVTITDTRFKKGHPPMGGRPKKKITIIKDFVKAHPYAVEELMNTLYEAGVKGDRESAMYIIDRLKGKPRAATDINISGLETLGTATVREIFKIARGEVLENKLLEEGSQDATEQRGSQGLYEAEAPRFTE